MLARRVDPALRGSAEAAKERQTLSHILAWICLVLVASTTAYGLQLTAAAMLPSAAAASQNQLSPATVTRSMLIVAVDPVTGERITQAVCEVPAYNFTSDVVLVDAADFRSVVGACNGGSVPAVRP